MRHRIVDLDGTILTLQADWPAVRAWLARQMNGYDPEKPFDQNLKALRDQDRPLYLNLLPQLALFEQNRIEQAPRNLKLIEELRHAEWALYTSNLRSTAEAAMKLLRLEPVMIVAKEDVMDPKPAPEGALLILKNLNWDPKQTLYIGDNWKDEESAKGAGVKFQKVNSY